MNNPESSNSGPISTSQGPDVATSRSKRLVGSATLPLIRNVRMCWMKRRMFFSIIVAGTLISVLYSFLLPKMYTSSTTIMPPNSDSGLAAAGLLGALSDFDISSNGDSGGDSLLGLHTPSAEFVGILESRTMKESLVERFDLKNYYHAPHLEDACKDLDGDTHILENSKNGQISITVRSKSPVLASRIAQGYEDELNRLVELDSTSKARRERIFLEGRLKELKQDLDDSSKALAQFATKNTALDIASQGKAMIESSLRLETDLASARSQMAGLQQEYSGDNVRVRAANARIEELQRQLNIINGQSGNVASRPDIDQSDLPSISALPSLGADYEDLARRVHVDEVVWENLTKQYEMAKVEEAREIPVVRVLDKANIPERKSSPVRRSIVMSGAILSFLIALISVNVSSHWATMGAEDERKKLVLDAIHVAVKYRDRFKKWPGVRWAYALFSRPTKDL